MHTLEKVHNKFDTIEFTHKHTHIFMRAVLFLYAIDEETEAQSKQVVQHCPISEWQIKDVNMGFSVTKDHYILTTP